MHISKNIKELCIGAALFPKSKSLKKHRIMMLYEYGIIGPDEVTHLIKKHKLKGA